MEFWGLKGRKAKPVGRAEGRSEPEKFSPHDAKTADFAKTGSRYMAEACAINFSSYPISYSTSIMSGGQRRLLLSVLM